MKYNENLDRIDVYKNSYRDEIYDLHQTKYHKLDWNEAATIPSPYVRDALLDCINSKNFNFYPDTQAKKLRTKLAVYNDVPQSSITVYNGSDSALKNIFDAFLTKGSKVFVLGPTYTQINTFILSNGAEIHTHIPEDIWNVNTHNELFLPLNQNDGVKFDVVYLNNPNNPTGVLYSVNKIRSTARSHPKTLFVIDEAYYDFCHVTSKDLAIELSNVVVVRTFSKAFGLAGLRLGYSIASEYINSLLLKIRNGKEVNHLAQVAGVAVLDDIEYIEKGIRSVVTLRNWFCESLAKIGIEVYNTHGNYVVIKHKKHKEILDKFFSSNVLVRDRSTLPQMEDCIRITVGGGKQMEMVLGDIQEITKE
jgi:histidinol-phosphate aminotransferase